MKRTPLYDYHASHGKLVDFAGYDMPIWYTNIAEEHLAVRNHAGIFDVSHMGRVVVTGGDATRYMERLLPTTSASQPVGKSYYTLLLRPDAGIIDDLIVNKRGDQDYLLVVNAANRSKDLEHMGRVSDGFEVDINDITESSTMIAVQGPEATEALQPLTSTNLDELKRFRHTFSNVGGGAATVTRTGYTGEDGFEVILYDSGIGNDGKAIHVWEDLSSRATPAGLGARDTLRIEAGLPLYGSDMDERVNPVEAELSWVITKGRGGYVGGDSMTELLAGTPRRARRGLILDQGIPRHGFTITDEANRPIGEVTSGTFSPVLRKGIAMGYVETSAGQPDRPVSVLIRGSPSRGKIVKPPFYDESVYGWKREIRK